MLRVIRGWWVPISFLLIYLPGLIYALTHHLYFPSNNLFTLITCWFNPVEDWQSYTNLKTGIALDFIFPLVLFLFATIYLSVVRNSVKDYVSIGSVYVNGIIATYIMSGLQWYFTGQSGSGTSILFFSFALGFIPIILINTSITGFEFAKKSKTLQHNLCELAKQVPPLAIGIMWLALFLLASIISIEGYVSNKEFQHFVGFGVFSTITITQVVDRWFIHRPKKREN